MKIVQITDAQNQLSKLVDSLSGNGDIVITRNDEPVARLSPLELQPTLRSIAPASVGAVIGSPFPDDLLDEMLER